MCLKHLRKARKGAKRYRQEHLGEFLAYNKARRLEYARLRALGRSSLEARQASRSLPMRPQPR